MNWAQDDNKATVSTAAQDKALEEGQCGAQIALNPSLVNSLRANGDVADESTLNDATERGCLFALTSFISF